MLALLTVPPYLTLPHCTVLYCAVLDLVLALLTVPVLDPPPLVHDPEARLHPGTPYLQRARSMMALS